MVFRCRLAVGANKRDHTNRTASGTLPAKLLNDAEFRGHLVNAESPNEVLELVSKREAGGASA